MRLFSHLESSLHNSFIVFIFSVTIATLAVLYSSNMLLYNKAIEKVSGNIERSLSNIEYLTTIPEAINKNSDSEIKYLLSELKKLENEHIKIELSDISSKIDLNFVDFTIFKEPVFRSLLNEKYTWLSLQTYREELGFTGILSDYRIFFRKDVDFEAIFTLYSLPNINNSSDLIIEKLYEMYTGNSGKASTLKNSIVNNRKSKKLFTDETYKRLFLSLDKDVKNIISIIPSWNINFINEKLLNSILAKYKITNSSIINIRKSREIKENEIKSLLNITKKNQTLSSYLGTKTTFWEIKITDSNNKLETVIIMGWDTLNENYRVISLKKTLL